MRFSDTGAATDAAVAMHRHRHVDVVEKRGEAVRFGGTFGDGVGHLLQPATVNGEKPEPRSELALLDDRRVGQEFGK